MKRLYLIALVVLLAACKKEAPAPTLELKSSDSVTISAQGGYVQITFSTNQDTWGYDLGEASSWIDANASSDLSLKVYENTAEQARTASIRIFAPKEGTPQASATVSLTQSAGQFTPRISLSLASPQSVSAEASVLEVDVDTNLPSFEAESSADWLMPTGSNGKLKISVSGNPLEKARSGEITVYAPSKADYQTFTRLKIEQAELVVEHPLETLSGSNCFLVTHRGPYCFDATVRGNGKGCDGLPSPAPLAPKGARLIWQDHSNMVKSVSLDGNNICFELNNVRGNALIGATGEDGSIIWSWHIWFPDVEIRSLACGTGYIMNVNLGALTEEAAKVTTLGLLYQWGRKDPFPGSPMTCDGSIVTKNSKVYDINGNEVSITASSMYDLESNNLAYSIAHPTVCISNNSQYSKCRDWLQPAESNGSLWGNPKGDEHTDGVYTNKGSKTFYDPCPQGWRVPWPEVFRDMTSTGGMVWAQGDAEGEMKWVQMFGSADFAAVDINNDGYVNLNDYKDGWYLYMSRKARSEYSYFPATTRYDGQYAMLMGSMVGLWANYWYNAPMDPNGDDGCLATAFTFGIKEYGGTSYTITASGVANGSRADAYAIRCVKE